MKRLLIVLFCLPLFAIAQDKPLEVEGTSPDLYLIHTIVAKENYYSIGRMYNISPKEFAPYNNLSMDKGLALGQKINIPLTSNNFVQSGAPASGEVLVPVYHTVKDKEGLFHVASAYNKLPVATLKKWNNISGESVNNGTSLIIGYLKVKKELSPLAVHGVSSIGAGDDGNVQAEPVKEMPKPVEQVPAPPKKVINKETIVKQPEKEEQVKQVSSDEVKPEIKKETPAKAEMGSSEGKASNEGVFKNDFSKQMAGKEAVKENGVGGVFKSTSGWEDGKYYCLYNNAAAGTIVKITNAITGKSVYAKVLDVIPDIKQNADLLIRISNAAAEQLSVSETNNFNCSVEYSK